jgi:uncharacterized protein
LQAALQQTLGDRIQLLGVAVTNEDSTLQVTVQYAMRGEQQVQTAQFSREI